MNATKVDYADSFSAKLFDKHCSAPRLFDAIFDAPSVFVRWLFDLRNWIVRPFGLSTIVAFKQLITESSPERVVAEKDDKHLFFRVIVTCTDFDKTAKMATLSTEVCYPFSVAFISFS